MKTKIWIIACVILLFCLATKSVNALSMGGVGIIPSQDKESRDWFILTLKPGETIKDSVVISNTSKDKQTVVLGAYDSELSETGAFALTGSKSEQKSIGKWIKIDTTKITLAPNEKKTIKFTITIPKDAIDGEYSGAVTAAMTPEKPAGSSGVTIGTRVGVRVYVTVASNYDKVFTQKLKGRILLQTESRGEAWYIDPVLLKRIYLADGASAYQLLRERGVGVKNSDLKKISIGIESRFIDIDTDNDNLPDKLEEAMGTNPNNSDTDGDGYSDGSEIKNGYNPNGPEKIIADKKFTEKMKGKILLQVESKGEAWYINPADAKRYYLANGEAAYQVMKYLGLGVKNKDLEKIPRENLEFTQASFAQALKNLGDSERISISNSQTVNKYGCQLKGEYQARRYDENEYVLGQSSYTASADVAVCQEKNIKPVYMENYWIGDDIYVRMNANDSFYKSDKNLIQHEKRIDTYLKNEYYKPGLLRLKSWSRKGNQIVAVAGAESSMGKSENIITIDAISQRVMCDSFKVEIPEMEYIATGKVDFSYDPEPVNVPEDIADSAFVSDNIDPISPFLNNTKDFGFKHYAADTASATLSIDEEEFLEGITYATYDSEDLYKSMSSRFCKEEERNSVPCKKMNQEIKALFNDTKKLIINPHEVFCSLNNLNNTKHRESYKDIFNITFSGQKYYFGNPPDFISITFSLKPEENNKYTLAYNTNGDVNCYGGHTDDKLLNEIMEKFNLYDKAYLSNKLEPTGSNWQDFINTEPNINIEQELLSKKDNWKTYVSKKTELSFKYPNIYEYFNNDDDPLLATLSYTTFFETGNAPTSSLSILSDMAGKTSITVSTFEDESVLNEKIQDTFNRTNKPNSVLYNIKPLIINGIDAIEITSKTPQTLEDAITKLVTFNRGKYTHSFAFTNFGSDFYLEILKTITFN